MDGTGVTDGTDVGVVCYQTIRAATQSSSPRPQIKSGVNSSRGPVSLPSMLPALAHDGLETFYLAVPKNNQVGGLTSGDILVPVDNPSPFRLPIYSSGDGTTWTLADNTLPDFPDQIGEVSMAAWANGDLLVGVTTADNVGGRAFEFRGGAWTELGAAVSARAIGGFRTGGRHRPERRHDRVDWAIDARRSRSGSSSVRPPIEPKRIEKQARSASRRGVRHAICPMCR